jgi:hypothetical protein
MTQSGARLLLGLLLLVAPALAPRAAPAAGLDLGVDARTVTRVVVERHLPSEALLYDEAQWEWVPGSYLGLIEDRLYPLAWATASLSASWEPWLLAVATLDPGVATWAPEHADATTRHGLPASSTATTRRWRLDGLAPADNLERGWLLREAYLELGLGPSQALELTLGKQRWSVLDGWVYDDFGFAFKARLDLDPLVDLPLALEARALLAHRYWTREAADTPLLDARAAWEWSPGNRLSAGATWAWDRAGFVPRLLTTSAAEAMSEAGSFQQALILSLAEVEGSSTLRWLDAALDLAWGELTAGLRGAWQAGSTSFTFPGAKKGRQTRVGLPGYATGLDLRWQARPELELSAFGLWLSGGRALEGTGQVVDAYGAFVSLVPYLDRTSLFFDGGLAGNLATREASLVGTSGRGVLGGGLGAALEWPNGLQWRATLAALWSDVAAPFTGGRFYGLEADLGLAWAATDWLDLEAEQALITPGTFYRDERSMWRTTAGIDAHY